MFKTIRIAGRILAQGLLVQRLDDGRVIITTGTQHLTGYPVGT